MFERSECKCANGEIDDLKRQVKEMKRRQAEDYLDNRRGRPVTWGSIGDYIDDKTTAATNPKDAPAPAGPKEVTAVDMARDDSSVAPSEAESTTSSGYIKPGNARKGEFCT